MRTPRFRLLLAALTVIAAAGSAAAAEPGVVVADTVRLTATVKGVAVYSRTAPRRHPLVRVMPDDPKAVAQELFTVLREFDDRGMKLIWVERPPDTAPWEGVNDRLSRAASR